MNASSNFFTLIKNNRSNRLIYLLLAILILMRIVFTFCMGMMPQDAYYFFYSEHLSLSYFDHPPVIAYLLRFFTSIFGQTSFAIKLADLTITGLTIISFYHLCKCFLKGQSLTNAVVLLLSTFMVTILSLVTTPDVPLLLFWTLSILTLYKAIFQEKKWYWLWSGLMMGLAFDSKYTAILLPLGASFFLLISKPYRKYLLSKWYWLAAIIFLLTISPVIIWNIQHDFVSIRFQTTNRAESVRHFTINIKYFLGVIGHQAAILIPVLFFGLVAFLYKAFRRTKWHWQQIATPQLFLLCFFLPTFLFFFGVSFFIWVKLNWLMPAYITGIIWVSRFFTKKWIRIQVIVSFIIHCALAIELIFYIFPVKSDDTWFGWKKLSKQVEKIQTEHPDAFVFSADGYKTSAVLNFYLTKKVYYQNVIGQKALELDYVENNLPALAGKNAIFLDSDPQGTDVQKAKSYPKSLDQYFTNVEQLQPILIKNNGKTVRKFFVYYCTAYQPK